MVIRANRFAQSSPRGSRPDPAGTADGRAPSSYASSGAAIAYAAPFFLQP